MKTSYSQRAYKDTRMKIAGRRQSKNIIDKTSGRNSFSIYGNRMTVGEAALNKSNLQKHINHKTSRIKTK